MTILLTNVHEIGSEGCRPNLHCESCHRDEDGPAYIVCGECFHIYPTARSLRRAYRRAHNQILRHGWPSAPWLNRSPLPLADSRPALLWRWLRSRFMRASSIGFCQERIHDF